MKKCICFIKENLQMGIEEYLFSLCGEQGKKLPHKISAVCSNSQKVVPNSVFVALKGRRADGHYYLKEAIKKGAKVLVVEHKKNLETNFLSKVCVVPDTRAVLPVLLNKFYDYPSEKMFCVGVTGTNGKTTLVSMLSFLFSRLGWRAGLIGTVKNKFENQEEKSLLTTPDPVKLYSLLNRFYQKGAQALVMEVSSIGLDQKRVEGVDFNVGVFTNLSEDHLDYHSNMSDYFQAKKKLFKIPRSSAGFVKAVNSINSSGAINKKHFLAVLNFDDPYGVRLAREIKTPYVSYGQSSARFSWEILSSDLSGSWFNLQFDKKKLKAYLPMPGAYNVSNAVAGLCCVHSAGFSVEEAVKVLKDFPGVPGRMQRVCPDKTPLVFVDYAHTPGALESALSFLHGFRTFSSSCTFSNFTDNTAQNPSSFLASKSTGPSKQEGRLIAVFGCGGERDKAKRPIMIKVAEKFSDLVILTSDNPRLEDPKDIIKDCMKGVIDKKKIIIEIDRRQAIYQALKLANEKDIVLIAGKGHEKEQLVGLKRKLFDDVTVAKECFSSLNP